MSIAGALVVAIAGTALSTGGYSEWRGDGDRFDRFVEWKVEDMLDEVDATDDQREKVHAIATATMADMEEFRDFGREGRQALIAALTQETVDREALETLRQNKLATADRASQRLLTALADAAEVLTPAQRAELPRNGRTGGTTGTTRLPACRHPMRVRRAEPLASSLRKGLRLPLSE